MRRLIGITIAVVGAMTMLIVSGLAARPDDQAELLKVREEVWRAWFANDAKALAALVPPDTIVISAGEAKWKAPGRHTSIRGRVSRTGGKLVRLEFPRTEIQRFGECCRYV